MPAKRISFNQRDAAHIYEWLFMYWHHESGKGPIACHQCHQLGKRLTAFIGPKDAARIRRLVRRFPGLGAKP